MLTPTAATVRAHALNNDGDSAFDFDAFGFGGPDSGPDNLEPIVAAAVGWVENMTARRLNDSLTDAGLVALADEAVYMRVAQQLVNRGTSRRLEESLDISRVETLRAGDFSVTYRGLAEGRRGAQVSPHVSPWVDLSETLLALATPDRRAELLAELRGVSRPLALSVEPSANPRTSYGTLPGAGGGYGYGGGFGY